MNCANNRQESILLWDPGGVGGTKVNDAVGKEEVMDEEVGDDTDKEK